MTPLQIAKAHWLARERKPKGLPPLAESRHANIRLPINTTIFFPTSRLAVFLSPSYE